MLVAAGGRMLLRHGNRDVLLARVDDNRYGVTVRRLPGWRSPVPPIRADVARAFGPDLTRWAHWFADHLRAPLHDGEWVLQSRVLPPYVLAGDLVREFPAAYLDWFVSGWNGAVPLRRLSEPTSGSVKAYRKLEVLPPVLLWHQSGLDGYLVLDGHDRLIAAAVEQVQVPILILARAEDIRWLQTATAEHEAAIDLIDIQVAAGLSGANRLRDKNIRQFARMAASVGDELGRTMGWQLPGGVVEWDRIAAAVQ